MEGIEWGRRGAEEETATSTSAQRQTNRGKETGPEADFLKVRPIYLSKCCIKMCTYSKTFFARIWDRGFGSGGACRHPLHMCQLEGRTSFLSSSPPHSPAPSPPAGTWVSRVAISLGIFMSCSGPRLA